MLAIDRPLNMYRTAVNVFREPCGAAIIARSEGEYGVDTEARSAQVRNGTYVSLGGCHDDSPAGRTVAPSSVRRD